MKKLFYVLIILVAGYWLYGKCSHKSTDTADVLKQVRVAVKTANLRTGPGTNYDFVLDASGNKQQVSQGTVLDVVAEQKGWYEVRLSGDATRTAYIKQSLCTDLRSSGTATQKARSATPSAVPGGNPPASTPAADQEPASTQPATPSVSDPVEEVVEEVTSDSESEDEVIF